MDDITGIRFEVSAFDLNNKRHAILMHVDVSALQRDSLTGLANRAMFDAQLDLAVSLAREHGRRTGVIIVDVNRMKLINDVHGHRVGDEALLAVAAEMRKMGGADCVTAKIGGDEFGVVLSANCDALTAPRLRATLKSESSAQPARRVSPYSYLRASALRYIRMTARPLASFSHRPTSQCTRKSVLYQSPNQVADFGTNASNDELHRQVIE